MYKKSLFSKYLFFSLAMGVKIYIWTEEYENVGHGSMTLSDGITHISWWPKKDKEMTPNQSWVRLILGLSTLNFKQLSMIRTISSIDS